MPYVKNKKQHFIGYKLKRAKFGFLFALIVATKLKTSQTTAMVALGKAIGTDHLISHSTIVLFEQSSRKKIMPKRTSINDIKGIEHLNELERIVKDKRNEKRADVKKERRNRHYVKLLINHQLRRNKEENSFENES